MRSGPSGFSVVVLVADLVTPGGDDCHAVDAGTARLDHDVELLLLEEAHALGRDLADLVIAGEPAELEVDGLGLGLGETARGQEPGCGEAGGGRPRLEQRTAAELADMAHGDFPSRDGDFPAPSY